ncbi:MAG: hypothetical protein ACPL4C_00535 [Brevinematia bacterium]
MNRVFDEIIDYIFNFEKYLNDLLEGNRRIENLGLIGLVITFFGSLFSLSSRLDIGVIVSTLFILVNVVYATFVIGLLAIIGKENQISTPRIFWFFFSVGLFDIFVILFYPLSLFLRFLMPVIVLVIIVLKLYYLIKGIARFFKISRGTSLVALVSPYLLLLILIILLLTSSYITISGVLSDIESSIMF